MTLLKSTLNPAWPHFLGVFSLILACFLGLMRLLLNAWSDPIHCGALLNRGSWLDTNHQNWQPDGCILHQYTEKEASTCLQSKPVIFIGDSVTRQLFFQVVHSLDASLPSIPVDETQKHADHTFLTSYGTNISFAWDPFLNTSYTQEVLARSRPHGIPHRDSSTPPAMLVLGSGLWYLRYANSSGGMPAWESKMEETFARLEDSPPADNVIILPIGQVVPPKLSAARGSTMRPADIDAMNSDLYHRIHPPSGDSEHFFRKALAPRSIALPLVFNMMVDESLTEDGLHYSDVVVAMQARILLNLRCNDVMPKSFPFDKTCCSRYPVPSFLQSIFLGIILLMGPYFSYIAFTTGFGGLYAAVLGKKSLSPLIISVALAFIFFADRTGIWLKEQKQFDPWSFTALSLLSLAAGLATVKRGESDMGFLNRDQTDEWKGWMQVAILLYHYFGASKISGIYNPVRVLVASYLFMTGYGHTTFYLRKADFGFLRVAQVLIRLNLFTILLAYTMDTTYISYYFTPLVSMWYLVIYATMVVGARFNDRTPLLLIKILLSAALMTWFMNESWLFEALFDFLHNFCAIHWSAREWAFRVNLDIWAVHVGMVTSILVIKIREHHLADHPRWPLVVKVATGISAVAIVWFFAFELYQPSKFTYNAWHPYISLLPVLAFAVLRNSSIILRSASSRAFAFVGKCSLETFVVQYHFWLAADTKGVLLVLPGTRWRPINFIITSIMFLYLCDRIAYAMGDITSTICGTRAREIPLPLPATAASMPNDASEDVNSEAQEISISLASLRVDAAKDAAGHLLPIEPDTPIRPNRWVDRLAESSSRTSSEPILQRWLSEHGPAWRLHAKISVFLVVLWLFNIFWSYPPGTSY